MGRRNFLVEGVSGTGKTSVCRELQRRGHRAVNGDTELAYQGDPGTLEPTDVPAHEHHLWRVDAVRALVEDRSVAATFFCGGSRNVRSLLPLYDAVFVLRVDAGTLERRLARRPPGEFGGRPEERELALRLHRTGEDVPEGVEIDATQPLAAVVDRILELAGC